MENNILNTRKLDLEKIEISDLIMQELQDLSELFGIDLELERDLIDYKIKMAMLGELITHIKQHGDDIGQEITDFLDEHNSPEELYAKINFVLAEFVSLHPSIIKSLAFDIPEILDLVDVNISDELIIQRMLIIADRLEQSYYQLNLI